MSRTVLIMMLALAGVGMSACGEDEPSTLRACEEDGSEKWNTCYDYSAKALYCVLEELRE